MTKAHSVGPGAAAPFATRVIWTAVRPEAPDSTPEDSPELAQPVQPRAESQERYQTSYRSARPPDSSKRTALSWNPPPEAPSCAPSELDFPCQPEPSRRPR